MAPIRLIGPADHGRSVTWEEYATSRWEEGYYYELVDGKLYVAPRHDFPENWVEGWAGKKLGLYSEQHPEIINYVSGKACVFVPGRPGLTCIGPDQTAFRDFPFHWPIEDIQWWDLTPLLVVQSLSLADPGKDLVRNVELYWQVPTIKEYWLFNTRPDPEHPNLRVHRRYGKKWRILEFAPNEIYTTRLLPDFSLILNSRT